MNAFSKEASEQHSIQPLSANDAHSHQDELQLWEGGRQYEGIVGEMV